MKVMSKLDEHHQFARLSRKPEKFSGRLMDGLTLKGLFFVVFLLVQKWHTLLTGSLILIKVADCHSPSNLHRRPIAAW